MADRVAAWAADRLALYVTADVLEQALLALSTPARRERFSQLQAYWGSLPADRFPNLLALRDQLASGDADAPRVRPGSAGAPPAAFRPRAPAGRSAR